MPVFNVTLAWNVSNTNRRNMRSKVRVFVVRADNQDMAIDAAMFMMMETDETIIGEQSNIFSSWEIQVNPS